MAVYFSIKTDKDSIIDVDYIEVPTEVFKYSLFDLYALVKINDHFIVMDVEDARKIPGVVLTDDTIYAGFTPFLIKASLVLDVKKFTKIGLKIQSKQDAKNGIKPSSEVSEEDKKIFTKLSAQFKEYHSSKPIDNIAKIISL